MVKETEIEKLLKSEMVKILKPNECALVYDEKTGILKGVCNKDGELKVSEIQLRKGKTSGQ